VTPHRDNGGDLDLDQATALGQVEALRDGPVPDPGEAYWAGFTARVRRRTPAPARAWVPWAGLATAAGLMLVMWMGGRALTQAPAQPDQGLMVLTTWEEDRVEIALDQVLGETGTDPLAGEIAEMPLADKQALLNTLRDELAGAAPPRAPTLAPDPGPA